MERERAAIFSLITLLSYSKHSKYSKYRINTWQQSGLVELAPGGEYAPQPERGGYS